MDYHNCPFTQWAQKELNNPNFYVWKFERISQTHPSRRERLMTCTFINDEIIDILFEYFDHDLKKVTKWINWKR